jgi:acetolactate synthase-1/2/3 large subunit
MPGATTPPSRCSTSWPRFAGIRVDRVQIPLLRQPAARFAVPRRFHAGQGARRGRPRLLVDVDVPWIPSDMPDNPATWWAHIDLDAEKRNFPIWTFPGNLRLSGDSHRILPTCLAALKARAERGFKAARRGAAWKLGAEGQARREQAAKTAANRGTPGEISPHYLCATLAKALPRIAVVLQRARSATARRDAADAAHHARHAGRPVGRRPRLLGRHGAGAEARLARAHVVQVVGDGTFYFSNPQSTLAVSRIQAAGADRGARQPRLGRGQGGDLARLSRRRGQGRATTTARCWRPTWTSAKVAEAAARTASWWCDPDAVEGAIARCLGRPSGTAAPPSSTPA